MITMAVGTRGIWLTLFIFFGMDTGFVSIYLVIVAFCAVGRSVSVRVFVTNLTAKSLMDRIFENIISMGRKEKADKEAKRQKTKGKNFLG